MPAIKMTINLPDSIRQQLKLAPWGNRQATSAICKTIDRYTEIMSKEKNNIKGLFSLAELNSLFECSNGCRFIPASEAFNQLLEKCSESELKKKLEALDYVEQFALLEILEDCKE